MKNPRLNSGLIDITSTWQQKTDTLNAFKRDWFRYLDYVPHEKQERCHYAEVRHKVICCGRRWGKSTMYGANEIMARMMIPNTVNWIVGLSYDKADIVFSTVWEKMIIKEKIPIKYKSENRMIIETSWGSTVKGKSADNPDSLIGEGLDYLLVDEAAKQKRIIWTKYLRPSLTDKHGDADFISTPEGFGWFYDLWRRGQDVKDESWFSIQSPSWENPYLDPQEIEEAKKDLDPMTFDQEYGAQFTVFAGQVYPEYKEEIMRVEGLAYNPDLPLYGAIDWGYENPCAVLAIQPLPNDRINILREIYVRHETVPDILKMIKSDPLFKRITTFYPDPESPGDIKLLKDAGFKVFTPKKKQEKLVLRGIQRVKWFLQNDLVRIDYSCTNMNEEFYLYRWKEKKEGKDAIEEPEKKSDHALSALRYFVVGYFGLGRLSGLSFEAVGERDFVPDRNRIISIV